MIPWQWLIAAVVGGAVAGWSIRTAVLVSQIHIENHGGRWVVYLATRIFYSTRSLSVAHRLASRLESTLRGRVAREEGDHAPSRREPPLPETQTPQTPHEETHQERQE